MLSLVAGPFTIVPLDPLETTVVVSAGPGMWLDRLGLVVRADSGSDNPNDIYVIQSDGSAVRVGYRRSVLGFGYAPIERQEAIAWVGGGWNRAHLPSTFAHEDEHEPLILNSSFGVFDDRVINFSSAIPRINAQDPDAGTLTVEHSFAGAPGGSGFGTLCYAGQVANGHRWYCVDRGNGLVYLYDSTNHVEIESARTQLGEDIRAVGYSAKHRLFFVVRRNGSVDELFIYSTEPVADSVSTPIFADTPRRGASTELSTTVLGDLGEPCPGRNVEFEVTAGTLDLAVVATDENGVATTIYRAPFVASTGETVTATLED